MDFSRLAKLAQDADTDAEKVKDQALGQLVAALGHMDDGDRLPTTAKARFYAELANLVESAHTSTYTPDGVATLVKGRPIAALGTGTPTPAAQPAPAPTPAPTPGADTSWVTELLDASGMDQAKLKVWLEDILGALRSYSPAQRRERTVAMTRIADGDVTVTRGGALELETQVADLSNQLRVAKAAESNADQARIRAERERNEANAERQRAEGALDVLKVQLLPVLTAMDSITDPDAQQKLIEEAAKVIRGDVKLNPDSSIKMPVDSDVERRAGIADDILSHLIPASWGSKDPKINQGACTKTTKGAISKALANRNRTAPPPPPPPPAS